MSNILLKVGRLNLKPLAYELAGEYEKALEDYIKAESLSNRNYSFPLEFMGRLFYKRGEKAKAYEYYIKALSKSPLLTIQSSLENRAEFKHQRFAQVIIYIVSLVSGYNFNNINML
jgi:tetratricopeptide (TPR) repeat protein